MTTSPELTCPLSADVRLFRRTDSTLQPLEAWATTCPEAPHEPLGEPLACPNTSTVWQLTTAKFKITRRCCELLTAIVKTESSDNAYTI